MSTHKRALAADDEPETGVRKKRSECARALVLPPYMRQLAHDDTSFFSVVPVDICTALDPFISRRGWVADPAALRFDRALRLDATLDKPGMIYFDADDALIVTMHSLGAVTDQAAAPAPLFDGADVFARPNGCIRDSRGRVFVSSACSGNAMVVGPGHGMVRIIGDGSFGWPRGMAMSLDGSVLYVASHGHTAVRSFRTETGAPLPSIGAGHLTAPIGVVVLSSGHVAVASAAPQGVVHVFTADGTLVREFGRGVLLYPLQMAVDQDDNVYVADADLNEVLVYAAASGRLVGRFGGHGSADGQFVQPFGVAISSTGVVAVTENNGARVQLFKCA